MMRNYWPTISRRCYRIRFLTLLNLRQVLTAVTITLLASTAVAKEGRSIALGGSAITHGKGVSGIFANPATLLHLNRRNRNNHLRLGAGVDFRDPGTLFDSVFEKDNLVDDIENAVDLLSDSPVTCTTLAISTDTVCLTNTAGLGQNFESLVDEIASVSEQPIELIADARAGFGFTGGSVPFALHFAYSVVVAGELIASEMDIEYLTILQDALIDGELTVGDIIDTVVSGGTQLIDLSAALDGTLDVVDPEDVLSSEFEGVRIDRQQFGLSFGLSFEVAGRPLDIGITPKVSSITTFRSLGFIATEFDDDTPSISEAFEDSETTTTTFTADIGATYALSDQLALSTVIRNLIPERADTSFSSFTVDTTPQIIVGGVYEFSNFAVNADLALNSAERDGVETQPLALGIEFGRGNYSLRGGISVDNGRTEEEAAITVGIGLGPLQVGSRIAALKAIQTGAQLSFSF